MQKYTDALQQDVRGMRIAMVRDGFTQANAEPVVGDKVRAAAAQLRKLGITVDEIDLPEHKLTYALCVPVLMEGAARTLFWGDGFGGGRPDVYPLTLMSHFRQWRDRAHTLSDAAKLILLGGTHASNQYGGTYYGKAVNMLRKMRAAYDDVLSRYDLLLMPTMPMRVGRLPEPNADRLGTLMASFGFGANAVPFNATHHPAMSIPCAMVDGLPVGMMLVGRHFDESSIYRVAHAYEQSCDWTIQ